MTSISQSTLVPAHNPAALEFFKNKRTSMWEHLKHRELGFSNHTPVSKDRVVSNIKNRFRYDTYLDCSSYAKYAVKVN